MEPGKEQGGISGLPVIPVKSTDTRPLLDERYHAVKRKEERRREETKEGRKERRQTGKTVKPDGGAVVYHSSLFSRARTRQELSYRTISLTVERSLSGMRLRQENGERVTVASVWVMRA